MKPAHGLVVSVKNDVGILQQVAGIAGRFDLVAVALNKLAANAFLQSLQLPASGFRLPASG